MPAPREFDALGFLENVFRRDLYAASDTESLAVGLFDKLAKPWPLRAIHSADTHFSCALFENNGSVFRRDKEHWTGAIGVVLDDIGETKNGVLMKAPPVKPTAIIETKPGSCQWIYLFNGIERDPGVVDTIQRSAIAGEMCDPNAGTITRITRLPGSLPEGKEHKARIAWADWSRRFDPRSIIEDVFQVPRVEAPAQRPARPANVPPAPPSPAYGEAALRSEVATLLAAPPGTRNVALNNAALKLGQLVPDGHLSESLIVERLTEAAAVIGQSASEAAATIKSGMTKGMTEPRGPKDELARLGTGPGAYIPAGMMHLPEISPAAVRLATLIAKGIRKQLPELTVDPAVDALIIRDMIEGAFWSGAKMRMFLLNPDECLVQFVSTDAWKFLCKRFGSPMDAGEIIKQLETDLGAPLAKKVECDARKAISKITAEGVVDYLKYENQRDSVEWVVDMFGTRSRLELKEDVVRIVLTHRTLAASGKVDPACVADYRAHFPLLDEVLQYIVAARFALDRKKAFIWLFSASDWGKDFLMGALRGLGLVVETSVKEVEAAFEGKPSGMSATEFKRAFILAMNEFKTVKSEIKQLGSYLELSPKNQLRTRVQIYTKLFMSAESVPSLVGENGVEDQFANRMSMIKGDEKLTDRALYKADQGRYFRSVQGYVAGELNRLIGEYQALGLEGAERCADTYLSAFLGRHGLDQHYERLSASYPTVADQAVAWIRSPQCGKSLASDGGYHYLTHATKVLDDYLAEHYTISEVGTLRRRKDEIMIHMSDDGRGNTNHRIGGRQVKSVKLKS
jgi:hypothetical protein